MLPAAQEHILAQEGGKERLLQVVTELSKAFALAVPHDESLRIRDDVGFFQAVRTAIAKSTLGDRRARATSITRSGKLSRRPSRPTKSSISSRPHA